MAESVSSPLSNATNAPVVVPRGWMRDFCYLDRTVYYISPSGQIIFNTDQLSSYLADKKSCRCYCDESISFNFDPTRSSLITLQDASLESSCLAVWSRFCKGHSEFLLFQDIRNTLHNQTVADIAEVYHILAPRLPFEEWARRFDWDSYIVTESGRVYTENLTRNQLKHLWWELFQQKMISLPKRELRNRTEAASMSSVPKYEPRKRLVVKKLTSASKATQTESEFAICQEHIPHPDLNSHVAANFKQPQLCQVPKAKLVVRQSTPNVTVSGDGADSLPMQMSTQPNSAPANDTEQRGVEKKEGQFPNESTPLASLQDTFDFPSLKEYFSTSPSNSGNCKDCQTASTSFGNFSSLPPKKRWNKWSASHDAQAKVAPQMVISSAPRQETNQIVSTIQGDTSVNALLPSDDSSVCRDISDTNHRPPSTAIIDSFPKQRKKLRRSPRFASLNSQADTEHSDQLKLNSSKRRRQFHNTTPFGQTAMSPVITQ